MPTPAGLPFRSKAPLTDPPRLVIDGRMVGDVPHGMARYVTGLAAGLRSVAQGSGGLPYELVFLTQPGKAPAAFAGFATCEVGARFLSPIELLEIPRVLKKLGAALYHSPSFSSLRWSPCPWIVTVHDLNHLTYGGLLEKVYYERLLKPFVRKAAAVVSVSDFSRAEIGGWAGIDPGRIELVYNSIDPAFTEPATPVELGGVLDRHGLSRGRYFFCLSNPKPHKNLSTLIEGFCGQSSGWELALNLGPDDLAPAPRLRLLGAPSDAEARALMAGAGAVVFPSLYEGFGLPPVEAACLGAPIVVSRIPAHREALADLAPDEVLWVDPADPAAWSRALERAARGEVPGASAASRARLLRRFSSEAMGAGMDRIYRRVLGIPGQ